MDSRIASGCVLMSFTLAQFVLLVLRLFGIVEWSWGIILLPSALYLGGMFVLVVLAGFITWLVEGEN